MNESRADRIADDLLSDMLQSVINDLTGSNLNRRNPLSQREPLDSTRDSGESAGGGLSRTHLDPSRARLNSSDEEEKTESTHMSSINGLLQVVRLEPSEQMYAGDNDDLSSQIGSSLLNPIELQSTSQSRASRDYNTANNSMSQNREIT